MEKFLKKFDDNNIYSTKVKGVDKNKLLYNHFKNNIPNMDR